MLAASERAGRKLTIAGAVDTTGNTSIDSFPAHADDFRREMEELHQIGFEYSGNAQWSAAIDQIAPGRLAYRKMRDLTETLKGQMDDLSPPPRPQPPPRPVVIDGVQYTQEQFEELDRIVSENQELMATHQQLLAELEKLKGN